MPKDELSFDVSRSPHRTHTIIGDTVNTAARVEEVTKLTGDDVLITEATRALLVLPFRGFELRPTVELKGKSERVRLYAPPSMTSGPAGAARRAGSA